MLPVVDPSDVRDWLASGALILSMSGSAIYGAWRIAIRPNFEHLIERAVSVDLRTVNDRLKKVEHELVPNGDEDKLPAAMRGMPARTILGQHIMYSEADRSGMHAQLDDHEKRIKTLEAVHLRDLAGGSEGVSS